MQPSRSIGALRSAARANSLAGLQCLSQFPISPVKKWVFHFLFVFSPVKYLYPASSFVISVFNSRQISRNFVPHFYALMALMLMRDLFD